jgi:hypothetical protein
MIYDTYLFACLLKEYDDDFNNEPYDLQYDMVPGLFKEFEKTKFNDKNKSLYDCIVEYLEHKYSEDDRLDVDDDE